MIDDTSWFRADAYIFLNFSQGNKSRYFLLIADSDCFENSKCLFEKNNRENMIRLGSIMSKIRNYYHTSMTTQKHKEKSTKKNIHEIDLCTNLPKNKQLILTTATNHHSTSHAGLEFTQAKRTNGWQQSWPVSR